METYHMIEITSAQSAAIITAMHASLELPMTRATKVEQMRLQAYVEIVADPQNAADTLALGEALNSTVMLMREDSMTIDPSALIEIHGNKMVRLALTYAGVTPCKQTVKTVWTVGSPRPTGQVLKLPESILSDWLA